MAINDVEPLGFNYSYGTLPLYNQAYQLLAGKDDYDTIFLNIETIIRNVVFQQVQEQKPTKDINSSEYTTACMNMRSRAQTELGEFMMDLVSMLDRNSSVPLIIFMYCCEYSTIPSEYKRVQPNTIQQHYLDDILYYFNEHTLSDTRSKYHNVTVRIGKYNGIGEFVDQLIDTTNQHNVLHISHHPLDYYIAPLCNRWTKINSYTGELVTYDTLGRHVFKDDLPFMKQLHILLGDKTDLKPVLKAKDRRNLISIAKQESWYLLPEDKVTQRLTELQYTTPYTI